MNEIYFVEFTDGTSPFFADHASSFKHMIEQLADYCGERSPLFFKALQGLESDEDCIALFNVFSSWEIERILKVEAVVYDKEGGHEAD